MENEILFEIRKRYDGFRKSEKKVADFLMNFEGPLSSLNLELTAKRAGVSQPTVVRFAKAMGFPGYREFRTGLIRVEAVPEEEEHSLSCEELSLGEGTTVEEVPEAVIRGAEQHLRETLKHVSPMRLQAITEALIHARKVAVYGVENSAAIAMDLVTKLLFLGMDAVYYQDYFLQTMGTACLTPEDVAIGVSYTGTTVQTVEALRQARRRGAITVAITNSGKTPLAETADMVIATENTQFLYGNAIFSRISQMAVVDMIYMGVIANDYGTYTKRLDQRNRLIHRLAYQMEEEK